MDVRSTFCEGAPWVDEMIVRDPHRNARQNSDFSPRARGGCVFSSHQTSEIAILGGAALGS
jgi:hypothetical protein